MFFQCYVIVCGPVAPRWIIPGLIWKKSIHGTLVEHTITAPWRNNYKAQRGNQWLSLTMKCHQMKVIAPRCISIYYRLCSFFLLYTVRWGTSGQVFICNWLDMHCPELKVMNNVPALFLGVCTFYFFNFTDLPCSFYRSTTVCIKENDNNKIKTNCKICSVDARNLKT